MRCSLDNEPVFCSCFLKAGSWGKGNRVKEKVRREKRLKKMEELFVLFSNDILPTLLLCLKRGKNLYMNHCTHVHGSHVLTFAYS